MLPLGRLSLKKHRTGRDAGAGSEKLRVFDFLNWMVVSLVC